MVGEPIAAVAARIRADLPPGVTLVAAAKSRTVEEVSAVIAAGVTCVGHNYVQEAARMIPIIGAEAQWHMIGHLQRNKAKRAVRLFDLIETVDSWRLAVALERHCAAVAKTMPVLIEVNSGREASKTGVMPEELDQLAARMAALEHIRVQGLMTMGPRSGNPEDARPYFRATREAFEKLAANAPPNVEMRHLSMGMSNSWQVAVEEGATMVRIGTALFGPRPKPGVNPRHGPPE